ncbi:tetratricopeptide repeat protein [Ornithinibacillus sp. JPR2-1]|uniref:tetratricopeptide repeat protein n=1 Tax=Ornithinibacillus sp. JPR2-1 TaxID=2094019 RepID=UPI0031D36EBF
MDKQELQKELRNKGFTYTANNLQNIAFSNNPIVEIQQILNECISPNIELPDDIYMLYKQLHHVSSVQEDTKTIVIQDLRTIVMEIVMPSDEESIIYMEDEELDEAVSLYSEAANGDKDAQVQLGHLYRLIERNEWAFPWFNIAAQAGNPEALYWLGNYYYMGKIVKKDLEKTFLCYEEAAEKGYPDAINNYADMYLRGEYVEKDNKRALKLFKKAAEHGVPEAMYTLGYMYENGVGTEIDLEESKAWFTKSALAGDVFAANRLGHEAVENGKGEEAISWYKMAAEQGDSYGEFNLGLCYENGIGTPINIKKAKIWYQKAALKGDEQAKERLKGL